MKQDSFTAKFISLLFVIALTAPLVASVMTKDKAVSSAEKRRLATLPQMDLSWTAIKKFPGQFEKYYNDHFGFRENIIKRHNFVLCRLFHVSPVELLATVGSDNWYFYNADGAINDYFGKIKYNPLALERFTYVLQDRQAWLHSLGIQYLFLPIPNKEAIYGEYLPARIRKHKGNSKYTQILDHLSQNSSFTNFIDTRQLMLANKDTTQLYLRTDSHWNHDGTYLVYLEIIRRLQQWYPDIEPLAQKKQKEWIEKFSGDIARLMNMRGVITERAPARNIEEKCTPRPLKRMYELHELPAYKEIPLKRLPVVSGCDEQKYKAIVIHDSFGKFLRPILSQQFHTVIYVHYMNFDRLKTLIKREKPDIVIDERVARFMEKALLPDPELEGMVLSEKFDDLPQVRMTLSGKGWHRYLAGSNGVKINTSDKPYLSFSTTGEDSSITFQLNHDDASDVPTAVRLEISSRQPAEMETCYLKADADTTTMPQCETRQLEKGANTIWLRILQPAARGMLAISPKGKGKYTLRSLVAKREDQQPPQ